MRVLEGLLSFGPVLWLLLLAMACAVVGFWLLRRVAPRLATTIAAIVLIASAGFIVAKSLSPAGKYAIGGCRGGFEYTQDEYYELSGGAVYMVGGGQRQRVASYYKKDEQWVFRNDGDDGPLAHQKLRFSVLGFDTVIPPIEGNEGGPTDFNRRRIIPFTRPHWIPEWLE